MVSSLIVGGTGVSGSFIVSGLIERGHDVTVYTTGRTVPTEEESPWWYDGSITRLEGGVDSAEDVDATLTEAYGAEWSFDHVFVRSICSTPPRTGPSAGPSAPPALRLVCAHDPTALLPAGAVRKTTEHGSALHGALRALLLRRRDGDVRHVGDGDGSGVRRQG